MPFAVTVQSGPYMGVLNFVGKGVNSLKGDHPHQRPRGPEYPQIRGMHHYGALTSLNVRYSQLTYLFATSINDINGLRCRALSAHLPPLVVVAHLAADQSPL